MLIRTMLRFRSASTSTAADSAPPTPHAAVPREFCRTRSGVQNQRKNHACASKAKEFSARESNPALSRSLEARNSRLRGDYTNRYTSEEVLLKLLMCG